MRKLEKFAKKLVKKKLQIHVVKVKRILLVLNLKRNLLAVNQKTNLLVLNLVIKDLILTNLTTMVKKNLAQKKKIKNVVREKQLMK